MELVAVITAPDKPQGRGKKVQPSPVKECALRLELPILQPTNLKNPEFQEQLRAFAADLQVVVAFRMLPEAVWSMPPLGTLNLHASLLPNFRGAAPINWAIIKGEKETGVSTFFLKHEIDTGNIILQEKEPIHPEDTVGTLYERLMHKGAGLVAKTIAAIARDEVQAQPQDESLAIHAAPKLFKETCEIDWTQSAEEVHNLVRGLSPYPAAWFTKAGSSYKVFRTALLPDEDWQAAPGTTRTDQKTFWHVACGKGAVALLEVQAPNKKRMPIADFLRGNRIEEED
ncbi:methionyl-tRNA formyltransferase [Nitritalea halalkaliphila LW7]|uniref:Methionyl-tRNA formyltransferase n=1 Tax=Nitritalea halalkaliphila LW7 TaxID=1189621 RepID=I5C996_9BACT|nr:methionyl-tRNA formyltransferase [Nitritalea halalkaliphila]EIM78398.1 methionyl-tRNA formyltransferase [Nitritalea halalkaliphila LW7]